MRTPWYDEDSPKPGDYDHFEYSKWDEAAGKIRGQTKLKPYLWGNRGGEKSK